MSLFSGDFDHPVQVADAKALEDFFLGEAWGDSVSGLFMLDNLSAVAGQLIEFRTVAMATQMALTDYGSTAGDRSDSFPTSAQLRSRHKAMASAILPDPVEAAEMGKVFARIFALLGYLQQSQPDDGFDLL